MMSSSRPQGSLPDDVYRIPRLGLDVNDPEEDISARRSEDGELEREEDPEDAHDTEEADLVVAAENAEEGVLGSEEEEPSEPIRGDENSMIKFSFFYFKL